MSNWVGEISTNARYFDERSVQYIADQFRETHGVDPASVLWRLDYLFLRIGHATIDSKVPRSVAKCQQAAQNARVGRLELGHQLDQAELAQKQATDATDGMRKTTALAAIRTKYDQQKRLAKFSTLVLGRECFQAKSIPKGLEAERDEIESLRAIIADR